MEDVDISDQTNSSAAFEFLRQIDDLKASQKSPEKYEEEPKKIEFKKLSKIKHNLKSLEEREQMDAEIDSPKLKDTKLVMPEYVVDQKKPSETKKLIAKTEKRERAAGKLMLSHL